jgi:hypothetical protein
VKQLNEDYNVAKELEDYLQKVTYTAGLGKDIDNIEIIVNHREQSAEIVITTDSHAVVNSVLNILAEDRIVDKYQNQLTLYILFIRSTKHHM